MATSRTIALTFLAVAASTLVSMSLATAHGVSRLAEDARLADQTHQVIAQIHQLLRLAEAAEVDARGFVITGDETIPARLAGSQPVIDRELARLAALVAANPAQAARARELTTVIDERRARLLEAVAPRQRGGFEDARQAVVTLEGDRALDRARVVAEAMIRVEQDLLAAGRKHSDADFAWTRTVTLAGTVGAVLALSLAAIQTGAELRRRRLAEASMRSAYEAVEKIVKARTGELQAALAKLRQSEDQFRVVTELSPAYLFRTDSHGAVEFISNGFCAFTGLTLERARGFGWSDAVDPEDRSDLLTAWTEGMSSCRAFDAECRLRSRDGQSRWFRVHVVPTAPLSAAGVHSWIGAAVDIHELKDALATRATALARAEEAQRESESASQLKDEFLATVSHELRTPLNAIVGWAHVLKLTVLTDQERAQGIEAIARNARAQTRLVEDLLDVSTMLQGRLHIVVTPVDLRDIVREAVETVAPAAGVRNIRIDVRAADTPVVVDGDPSRLQQIAWNLLSNAVKFTPKEGEVHVTVDVLDGCARLRVEDSGEGIDPAFLPHVFVGFRQGPTAAMRSGLGLGLGIVRRLVELHGGIITAESAGLGQGATFLVMLPLHADGSAIRRLPGTGGRSTA